MLYGIWGAVWIIRYDFKVFEEFNFIVDGFWWFFVVIVLIVVFVWLLFLWLY